MKKNIDLLKIELSCIETALERYEELIRINTAKNKRIRVKYKYSLKRAKSAHCYLNGWVSALEYSEHVLKFIKYKKQI